MKYADLHCDTLTAYPPFSDVKGCKGQITIDKLTAGNCVLQCFAVFSRPKAERAYETALDYFSTFQTWKSELKKHGIQAVLTVENGEFLDGKTERIQSVIDAGVKIFAPAWKDGNSLGFGHGKKGGLTDFGKVVMENLSLNGVIADVSHLSDDGIKDVFSVYSVSKTPVVATHSLCRGLCERTRNLTDGQIRKIADLGGVVGVTFVRAFVGEYSLLDHIKRLVNVGGEDVVAIGSDFDGTEDPIVKGADETGEFLQNLSKAGLSERIVEKLAYKNAFRFLKA